MRDLPTEVRPREKLLALGPAALSDTELLALLLRWHPIVAHDGALSVRRAFTRAELEALLAAAGVQAEIRWHFPFRWTVESCPK